MLKRMFFALAVCASFAARADQGSLGSFAFSVEAGANFGNATAPSQVNSASRTGWAVGLATDVGLSPVFSLQPEILVLQEGSETSDSNNVRVRTNFQSVRVPLMVKARLGQWKFAPYVFAGPQATYHFSQSAEAIDPSTSSNVRLNRWDFGLAGGVGVDVGPFFANARYDLGLTNLDEAGADMKTRGILVLAGLRL